MTLLPTKHLTRLQRFFAIYGAAAIVVVLGIVTLGSLRRAAVARESVAHTKLVIEMTDETLLALQDAETGQRGFLITGEDRYLEPYNLAMSRLAADSSALRSLIGDNPEQQRRVDTLTMLMKQKVTELRATIDLRRTHGFPAAAALVKSEQGRQTMETMRSLVSAIRIEERGLLAKREIEEQRWARSTYGVIIGGSIAAALIALMVNALLTRYGVAQETAARTMAVQNTQLQEQGLELELQHQQLQEQATELEAANEELQATSDSLVDRTDEAERARVAAETANAAKSEFLAAMSHELRTPLNAISGYTELIMMGVRGPITSSQLEDLRRIKKSSEHLLSLINEILNLARIESGNVDLRLTDVPVGPLLEDVAALVAPQMQQKGITCTVADVDLSLVARTDAERTRQILLNVLTNACKFTESGGRVTVDADSNVTLPPGADQNARALRIRITDSGRGIPSERLAAIFEPFVQIDRRLTPEGEQGLGLGLAISRDLARALGGDLTAESVVGKGSTFTLVLPADAPSVEPPANYGISKGQRIRDLAN